VCSSDLQALLHFEQAQKSGRDLAFVRTLQLGSLVSSDELGAEAMRVLASVGGVEMPNARSEGWGRVRFDFDAANVLREIISSGCVPDQRAHQYFPTPRHLAERIVELAKIGPDDRVLEPSAGQGAISELLPRDRTLCVEVNALHCAVLRAKGFTVLESDFLKVDPREHAVTRVVMNPPFDHAQWRRHVEHAASMLQSDGAVLVAILPSWAPRDLLDMPGFSLTWSEPIRDAFPGTSVSVVILVAERV
jgi:hypothetical protein